MIKFTKAALPAAFNFLHRLLENDKFISAQLYGFVSCTNRNLDTVNKEIHPIYILQNCSQGFYSVGKKLKKKYFSGDFLKLIS